MKALSRIQWFRLGACLAGVVAFWAVWQGAPVSAAYKEAQYAIVQTLSKSIEIREYAPQLVAEVTVPGARNDAANSGFRQLFAYITGANTSKQSVAMTTPVVEAKTKTTETIAMTTPVTESSSQDGWVIRFFLPSNYTLKTVPTPTNKQVVISETRPRKVAVIRFSGMGNNESLNKHERLLREALIAEGKTVLGTPEYAFYNAPFTLPFLRRNEVMLAVE
ncbi:MAG: heme-binding protein [Vampirovibrionales bacterium]|nr:heme-binding protein [Vampirovibrionales bacterium]